MPTTPGWQTRNQPFRNPLRELKRLIPAVESYLKIVRQFNRLAGLNRLLTEARAAIGRRKPR